MVTRRKHIHELHAVAVYHPPMSLFTNVLWLCNCRRGINSVLATTLPGIWELVDLSRPVNPENTLTDSVAVPG